ncbi:hypothetical protein EXIGLDRAFT_58917 [Exidia glandulosa HHB12029]|uniref:Uncharacterized protein n=1 Tax=Exidia glandulosa HHB12029 TaxID=1314781 RepID=A0A165I504_EXIGL|nr:hypothetical protein EXIGLDRAFT_58917 [Exidia glandulosa HHB12029]
MPCSPWWTRSKKDERVAPLAGRVCKKSERPCALVARRPTDAGERDRDRARCRLWMWWAGGWLGRFGRSVLGGVSSFWAHGLLKPEPIKAEPKPRYLGRAGPAHHYLEVEDGRARASVPSHYAGRTKRQ